MAFNFFYDQITVPSGSGEHVVYVDDLDEVGNILSAGAMFASGRDHSSLQASTPNGWTAHGQTRWRFSFKKDVSSYDVEIYALYEEI